MENENLDLDVKPTGNKDIWLFLIIVDIILLCVFGFYLYKHFSVSLFQTPAMLEQTAPQEESAVLVEETVLPQPVAEPTPVQTPAAPEVAVEEEVIAPATVQPQETRMTDILPAEEKPAAATAPSTEKKISVIVGHNPKSKYRRVTFRWYGEGEKVAIVSGFTMSKPQALKKKDGYWETTLSILPGTYRFLYVIDGVNTRDPYSPEEEGRSVVEIK